MPRFDGTGPLGKGPMTGRGEGYCAIRLPDQADRPACGIAGAEGRPVCLAEPPVPPVSVDVPASRPVLPIHRSPLLERGRGGARRRGRHHGQRR